MTFLLVVRDGAKIFNGLVQMVSSRKLEFNSYRDLHSEVHNFISIRRKTQELIVMLELTESSMFLPSKYFPRMTLAVPRGTPNKKNKKHGVLHQILETAIWKVHCRQMHHWCGEITGQHCKRNRFQKRSYLTWRTVQWHHIAVIRQTVVIRRIRFPLSCFWSHKKFLK